MVSYTQELTPGEDEVYIEITKDKNEITDFKVVYYTLEDGRTVEIVRYDCRHGFAHKDILCGKKLQKEKMPDLPYKELFNLALHDIKNNWRNYKIQHRRLKK